MEDRRSTIRDLRSPILGLCFVTMRLLRWGKNLLMGSSSSLAHRRVPNNESGRGDRVRRARLEGMKKPPHRVVRGRVRRVRASR